MTPRRGRRAAVLGGATFVAALLLAVGVATMPGAGVQAQAPVQADALAGVAKMNADANATAARRSQREGAAGF